jgi:hypothetical protein
MAKKTSVNPLEARLGLQSKKSPKTTKRSAPITKVKKELTISSNPLLKRLQPNTKKQQQQQLGAKKRLEALQGNPLLAALNGDRGKNYKELQSIKNNNYKTRNKPSMAIKNTAQKQVLRVVNLENGTSSADLETVLKDIGPIQSVTVKDLASGSTTGEVIFKNFEHLKKAHERLNGVVADGRVVEATICVQEPGTAPLKIRAVNSDKKSNKR